MLSGFVRTADHFIHDPTVVLLLGSSQAILLGVMAYDCYVVILKPLHYSFIMRKDICILMTAASLSTGSCFNACSSDCSSTPFCAPNHIEHLLKLTCGGTQFSLMFLNTVTSCIAIGTFLITVLLFKMQSQSGRQKAFSTCESHLSVVALLYVPVLLNYMIPTLGTSSQRDMMLTLMYSASTPVLNPLIYTLRYQKRAVKRFWVKMTLLV